uniref:Phorbol-ester/DAG-type domain-containing protein n=1 Tax=Opuntia streptacantha TaxID=393608 RepID=A0A7C8YH47_OPUST
MQMLCAPGCSLVKEFLCLLLCCFPKREMVRPSRQPNEIEKLELNLHQHELLKTWKRGYFCDECDKPVSNWSFRCKKCDFNLHPGCALKKHEKNDMQSWIPKKIMTCSSQQPDETKEVGGGSATHDDAHSEQPIRPGPKWRVGAASDLI